MLLSYAAVVIMNIIVTLCGICSFLPVAHALRMTELFPASRSGEEYETLYAEMPVDHFGYANQDTFQLRYLKSDAHWGGDGAPIFFYTGNEGDITWFCNNTGFMWEMAPQFKALLIFAEHRYYGESMPYGNDSYKDPAHLGYLSSEQALADFATLIQHLKTTLPGASNSPVVGFGGSYGGMLSAWFRMKYPHMVIGSLAASAPVWQFEGLTPCDTFWTITTDDFRRESTGCVANVKRSWGVISKIGQTASGRANLTSALRLCDPLKSSADVEMVKGWIMQIWGNLAMMNYPYKTDFMEPLPGWPVKVVCSYLLDETMSDQELVENIGRGLNVYFNTSGTAKCFNTSQQGQGSLGDQGWGFQACTEMVMPFCSNGETDMFEPTTWNLTEYMAGCQAAWKVPTRPRWVEAEYGGKNISAASNIIFSNGLLDPWYGGGVLESLSESLIAIQIKEGAHHLDLRFSNPEDPLSVIQARKREVDIIHKWLVKDRSRMV